MHKRTLHWCYSNDTKLQASKRKSEIQDGGFENSVAHISTYTHDSNDYTQVFGVRQHGETTGNTDLCIGVLENKDGGH